MTRNLIGIALLILIGYGCIEAWPLLAGPSLTLASPVENASFPDGVVSVRGKVARTTLLTLNDLTLLYDQNGDFSSTLTFPRGGSILTFVATDRFGRSVTETRSIFVSATSSRPQPNN
jgi:hypothetical protein